MSPQDDYLERVKSEIRADAAAVRQRAPQPRHDPPPRGKPLPPPASGIQRDRLDYTMAELVGAHYVGFVDQAFRSVLKRPPDEAGMDAQIRLLAAGASKAEVLGNLRWSAEGRRIGTRIKGLPARYLLAKAARVPVVGYFVDWTIALAGLPVLLRHQRAADTSVEARFGSAAEATRVSNARIDALQVELGHRAEGLAAELQQLRSRVDALQARVDALEPRATRHEVEALAMLQRVDGLQHVVHANNHWVATLQGGLEQIEEVARARQQRTDELVARVTESPAEADARASRHAAWSEALARELRAHARVFDLGSGDGTWLAAMATRGIDASGVEPVGVLARHAQSTALPVAEGQPFEVLARCADGQLDALTLSATACDARSTLELLQEAIRALAPGGWMLVRIEHEVMRATAFTPWDARRWSGLLVAAGFAETRTLGADGDCAVIARKAAS